MEREKGEEKERNKEKKKQIAADLFFISIT
jgi:hypothetical protein